MAPSPWLQRFPQDVTFARHADGSAKINIDTLEVIDSSLARRHRRICS
ncbi:MAG: hypothetical protein H0V29_05185 [Thermoleophilaceae bacterium]|nr:hypothetical protein [Thermoleophilaceae bacterium]